MEESPMAPGHPDVAGDVTATAGHTSLRGTGQYLHEAGANGSALQPFTGWCSNVQNALM